MATTKKEKVAEAKAAAELATRTLRANEILWDDEWKAAPNPFLAIKTYRSEEQRARREKVLAPWRAAVSLYESIKPKTKESNEL